jgi:hypothetical protein
MKTVLLLLLAAAPWTVQAVEIRVLLVNETSADITVESSGKTPQAEVPPRESRTVSFQGTQRLRFGRTVAEYRTAALEPLARADPAPVVLQAGSNRALSVLPKGTRSPRVAIPPQPAGFPLRPSRLVDPERVR